MTPAARARVKTTIGFGTVTAFTAAMILSLGGAQQAQLATPQGYITGIVRSSQGPEAGVWVIAETKELPTNFIKIVVTDDQGRFIDARAARRATMACGSADTASSTRSRCRLKPGATAPLALTATLAPRRHRRRRRSIPADYWLSLLEPPAKNEFPGTGATGNGIGPAMQTQNHYINSLKIRLQLLSSARQPADAHRSITSSRQSPSSRRTPRRGSGGSAPAFAATSMYAVLNNQGKDRLLKTYADWTERIAKGEVPPAPARPKGVERNLVVTLWDVGDDHSFMHDEVATDKNRPTRERRRADLRRLGGPRSARRPRSEPEQDRARSTSRRASRERRCRRASRRPGRPSLHFGNQHLWANPPYNPADPHNPMLDSKGRVWMTSKIRGNAGSVVVQQRRPTSTPTGSRSRPASARRRTTIRRRSSSR